MNPAPSIFKRVTILSGVLVLAATAATFVPGDTFAGNSGGGTFNSKGLTLQIDSKATYNGSSVSSETWNAKNLVPGTDKFFNYSDVKPGDYGCNVISVHATQNDAYECVDFTNLKENDPKGKAPLAPGIQFFGWIDNGDGKYDPKTEKSLFGTAVKAASVALNNTSYALGDSKSGGSCKVNTTKYFATCWCVGALSVDPKGNFSCDGSTLGNAVEDDTVSLTVDVRAVVAGDNPNFTCTTATTTNSGGNSGGNNGNGSHDDGGKGSGGDQEGKGNDGKGGSNEGYDQGWSQTKGWFSWNWPSFFGHKS